MKHSESVKIYQASRYHGISSRQFYLTYWGTWYNYARTLPGGGGGGVYINFI